MHQVVGGFGVRGFQVFKGVIAVVREDRVAEGAIEREWCAAFIHHIFIMAPEAAAVLVMAEERGVSAPLDFHSGVNVSIIDFLGNFDHIIDGGFFLRVYFGVESLIELV